jgi:hypothetical protein
VKNWIWNGILNSRMRCLIRRDKEWNTEGSAVSCFCFEYVGRFEWVYQHVEGTPEWLLLAEQSDARHWTPPDLSQNLPIREAQKLTVFLSKALTPAQF